MIKEVTILVHGFNKSSSDMSYLEAGLKSAGFDVISVSLPTTFSTLEQCRNSLYLQIKEVVDEVDVVNFVAHSMGGLITRSFIDFEDQKNVGKCIFIATPHNGSKLASIANYIPLYSAVFKPIRDLLPSLKHKSFGSNKTFKIGAIAGNKNKDVIGRLFLSDKSDGRVEISSVITNDIDELIILPYNHNKIHHKRETLIAVKEFLITGSFDNYKQSL